MATKKQKAAARRNIKKAHAANRRRGKKSAHRRPKRTLTKTSTKKLKSVRRHLKAAAKNLKHAHAIL